MADIPEHLLRRSAEAKAKALGLPVEQVLAEMKGEAPPAVSAPAPAAPEPAAPEAAAPEPAAPEPAAPEAAATPESVPSAGESPLDYAAAAEKTGMPATLLQRSVEAKAKATGQPASAVLAEMMGESPAPADTPAPAAAAATPAETPAPAAAASASPAPSEPAVETPAPTATPEPAPSPGGEGTAGRMATAVAPRPVAAPEGAPEGVRTQRLLTVVKAKAIQQVKAEPTDKVNTWPHLMIAEFAALMAVTALTLVLSVILQAPLLEAANFNATPNPSKAPWYFLGLQELLSYFDPQIAGVTVPTIIGLIGFMAIPYVDRNPSNKPSDRKFAIFMYTFFIMGSGMLTILGVLFRGPGFNFTYPWADGIWFDDLKDWVYFE